MAADKQKIVRYMIARLISLAGLVSTGILYLTVWGFMVLHCVSISVEYGVVLHPLVPEALFVSLAAPFLLINWWWSSMICEMFGIPMFRVSSSRRTRA